MTTENLKALIDGLGAIPHGESTLPGQRCLHCVVEAARAEVGELEAIHAGERQAWEAERRGGELLLKEYEATRAQLDTALADNAALSQWVRPDAPVFPGVRPGAALLERMKEIETALRAIGRMTHSQASLFAVSTAQQALNWIDGSADGRFVDPVLERVKRLEKALCTCDAEDTGRHSHMCPVTLATSTKGK